MSVGPGAAIDAAILWQPAAARIESAEVTRFRRFVEARTGRHYPRYDDLWHWSVEEIEDFWVAVWDHFDVPGRRASGAVLAGAMPQARWFEGARLNFASQVLRHELATPALVWEGETVTAGEMSWLQLREQVAAVAASLRELGVVRGDRVVAYLPNVPQAVVAFLACASLGAIWSICAPEMGPLAVQDRYRQIEPKILIACDGYRHGGKAHDRRGVLRELVAALPSLQALVWVPLLDAGSSAAQVAPALRGLPWRDALARPATLQIEELPFDHPLWIVYSSGTTGLPKAIVHGHGGILLSGLATTALMSDLGPGHRALWVVSTGWIVWNLHLTSLLVGATMCLYDGAVTGPGGGKDAPPDWGFLWRLVARMGVQSFGAGAAYFAACLKQQVDPHEGLAGGSLAALRTIYATGSPLTPETNRWIYERVKRDLWLSAISGGTDIAGGFLVGSPTLPVREGEMQCRALGAAVYAFDESGRAVTGEVGELVCTRPMPAMPLRLWNDTDGSRLRESYFDTYQAADGTPIWRHGDWLRLVPREGAQGGIIYGRSDATINRNGIRMGTAELYRAVEAVPEVLDSLVVDLEYLGREPYMALFVMLAPGQILDTALGRQLRLVIRNALSARHVPDEIVQAPAVPRNLTGKKLELPIKKLLLGHAVEKVINADAMANPECIAWYVAFGARRAAALAVPPATTAAATPGTAPPTG